MVPVKEKLNGQTPEPSAAEPLMIAAHEDEDRQLVRFVHWLRLPAFGTYRRRSPLPSDGIGASCRTGGAAGIKGRIVGDTGALSGFTSLGLLPGGGLISTPLAP